MYQSVLNLNETEKGIKVIKDNFERYLAQELDLVRVSSPLFVNKNSGLNDNLNGVETPVSFIPKDFKEELEIVHSLAKWKRYALDKYQIPVNQGLYCDMNAIRKDETLDDIHSLYVDQWDWEKHINNEERTIKYLKQTVSKINQAILKTQKKTLISFPKLKPIFSGKVTFITSEDLLKLYPKKSPKARETAFAKLHGTIFIIGIGHKLSDGQPHDLRAPDYDDWNLNGDLLVYYPLLKEAIEISLMGIRVNKESLVNQLKLSNNLDRLNLPFHKALMNDQLPLSIGGGIGQSRLCLVLLNKKHIGEVQASSWSTEELKQTKKEGIELL
ncbi:MAG: aspartate--ammonia ligase [Bacilli bacterium]|nr:aspartate--ammonia ligase [Bacilli bacterium]